MRATVATRFEAKVERAANGCWNWKGVKNRKGYGFLKCMINGKARPVLAHRVSYELHIGPVPDGFFLDHLCSNPSCVNPEHLEPVTTAENNRRAAARRGRASQCGNGHAWTPDNTRTKSDGRRACKVCQRSYQREHVERNRMKNKAPAVG